MRKKIYKLHSGFTVVELLVSMLIMMVVAAAMVPVIGPKKIKVPNTRQNHGIFECYYDENGDLKAYSTNNRGGKNAPEAKVVDDHCEFEVPIADKYEIFAIGAGSAGYTGENNDLGYIINGDEVGASGYLYLNRNTSPTGNGFYESIGAAAQSTSDFNSVTEDGKPLSMSDMIKETLAAWAESKTDKVIYAGFKNIKGPLAKGGSGLAARKTWQQNGGEGVDCSGCNSLTGASAGCPGPYKKTGGGKWFYNDNLVQALADAHENNQCYIYYHAPGGNSAPRRELKSGYTLLVPVYYSPSVTAGIQYPAQAFDIQFDEQNAIIDTKSGHPDKKGQVDLKVKAAGCDATDTGTGLNAGKNGNDNSYNPLWDRTPADNVENKGNYMKLCTNVTSCSPLTDTNFYSGFEFKDVNYGASHGIEDGTGRAMAGALPQAGSAEYRNDAFKWEYSTKKIRYFYGKAGEPGKVNYMIYTGLKGKLYLFPGQHKKEGNNNIKVTDTVVSHSENRGSEDGYMLTAASAPALEILQRNEKDSVLKASLMPNPESDIIAAATVDNSVCYAYLSRIEALGYADALAGCKNANNQSRYCPGFGGSGAYPMITNVNATNRMKITDQQYNVLAAFYNNFVNGKAEFSKDYNFSKDLLHNEDGSPKSIKCPYGNLKTGNINNTQFCQATGDRRSDGAVVIIW